MSDMRKRLYNIFGFSVPKDNSNSLARQQAFPRCKNINMRDHLNQDPLEFANILVSAALTYQAIRLLMSHASVPTQQKYVQKVVDSLSEYATSNSDEAYENIEKITKKISVVDGPFLDSAEQLTKSIAKQLKSLKKADVTCKNENGIT